MSMCLGRRRKDVRLYFDVTEAPGILSVFCLCHIKRFRFLKINYYKTEAQMLFSSNISSKVQPPAVI